MSDSSDEIPTFEQLAADAEIAALLDFQPVPRKMEVEGGWSPEKQREFIARLASHGSANKACTEMGMHRTGMTKVQHSPGAKSFRDAWRGAVDLARSRRAQKATEEFVSSGEKLPTIDHRFKHGRYAQAHSVSQPEPADEAGYLPGIPAALQELDYREALDHERRAALRWDESIRRVRDKIFICRRAYLLSIADDPARRAAWELLCGPADWAAAREMQAQPDEDREPVSLGELKTASWQVPLKTGFVPGLTDASRALAANTLQRLEQSIRRNDPRWSTEASRLGRGGSTRAEHERGDGADGEGE